MAKFVNLCESCSNCATDPSPIPFRDLPWWEKVCLKRMRQLTMPAEASQCINYQPIRYPTRFERILKEEPSV
jgi:hypothetical protein